MSTTPVGYKYNLDKTKRMKKSLVGTAWAYSETFLV